MNQFLADDVVRLADEPRLTAARLLEPLERRTGVPLLELAAMFFDSLAYRLDRRTRILVAIAVRRNLDYTEVNAHHACWLSGRRGRQVNRDVQVEGIAFQD